MATFALEPSLAHVRGRGPALILMHDNPDPDSMAAAECLRVLLSTAAGLPVTVARGGIVGRAENRAMISVLRLQHVHVESIDMRHYRVIALVDTQPETGNNSLPPGHHVDIVVDHHPLRPESRRAPWCDVREEFGASSTIAYSYLRSLGIPVTERLATAILYAIKSETRDLLRDATDHEHEAYSRLMKMADFESLQKIAAPKVPAAHFAALDRALRAAEVRDSLLAVNLGSLDYPDLVAELADLLLPYERAHWVLCVGQYHGIVYLSLRTDVRSAHAGDVIRAIVGPDGAAGGHGAVAGGRLHEPVVDDRHLAAVYASLVDATVAHLGFGGVRSTPLLPAAGSRRYG